MNEWYGGWKKRWKILEQRQQAPLGRMVRLGFNTRNRLHYTLLCERSIHYSVSEYADASRNFCLKRTVQALCIFIHTNSILYYKIVFLILIYLLMHRFVVHVFWIAQSCAVWLISNEFIRKDKTVIRNFRYDRCDVYIRISINISSFWYIFQLNFLAKSYWHTYIQRMRRVWRSLSQELIENFPWHWWSYITDNLSK